MTEQTKRPRAGEWWEDENGLRCHVIGIRADGRTVFESRQAGSVWTQRDTTGWQQLEECDSFEWVKPDWVEITDPDHVLRRGVDHVQFKLGPKKSPRWYAVDQSTGFEVRQLGCKIRCLREDLPEAPPAPPKTKTITMMRWLCSSDGVLWFQITQQKKPGIWKNEINVGTESFEVPDE